MPRSFIYIVVALVLVVGGAIVLTRGSEVPADGDAGLGAPAEVQRVDTAEVGSAGPGTTLRFAGTVRSARRARLSFVVGGRLASRPVVAGDRVAAGATLARLDAEELGHGLAAADAALGEARSQAEQAERERRRVERLASSRAATDEEVERARAGADAGAASVRRAEAQLAEARRRSREAVLTAPWAGTVTEVLAQPGEYLGAGDPVLEVAGEGRPEIEIRVPESFLADLAPGATVEVALPLSEGAGALSGRVLSAGAAAGGPGRLFPVLVGLAPDATVVPGQAVEVLVARRAVDALTVPLAAVLNPGGDRPRVFRLDADGGDGTSRVTAVAVRVESLSGERVAVTSSELAQGDRVVVGGHLGLIDGDPVRTEAETGAER